MNSRVGDLLPGARVCMQGLAELVLAGARGGVNRSCGVRRSAADGMWERLVLGGIRGDGLGSGEIGAFEVGGGEVGDAVADGGTELGDGLLDLRRVVVRF